VQLSMAITASALIHQPQRNKTATCLPLRSSNFLNTLRKVNAVHTCMRWVVRRVLRAMRARLGAQSVLA
jgi:hypothetical protein